MAVVTFDGKAIIPGPLWTIRRSAERGPDGVQRGGVYQITLKNSLVAHKGSPDSSGNFWTSSGYPPDEVIPTGSSLAAFRAKLGALDNLFKNGDGKYLELRPFDGTTPIKCQPRFNDLTYDEGLWVQKVDYTINLEADWLEYGSLKVYANDKGDEPPEESWSLDGVDEEGRTYRLVHNVSAKGNRLYKPDGSLDKEGWQVARERVLGIITGSTNRLGFVGEHLTAAGVLDLTSHAPFDYVRNQHTDIAGGQFSVTETWFCANPTDTTGVSGQTAGKAVEELIVDTRYSGDDGRFTVTVNGTIRGLEERNNTTRALVKSRWDNANERFAPLFATSTVLQAIAESYSGKVLNPAPLSSTVTRNKVTGVINYSIVFDNRPANSDVSFLSEIKTISDNLPADVFAEIPVPKRPYGPVLQDAETQTHSEVTVQCDIRVKSDFQNPNPTRPLYNPLADLLLAIGSVPTKFFISSDRRTWVAKQGTYSRTTTAVYEL